MGVETGLLVVLPSSAEHVTQRSKQQASSKQESGKKKKATKKKKIRVSIE